MSTLVALPTMDTARRHKKMLRDGSGEVWPDNAEVLFSKAIQEFDRQSTIASANSPYPPDLPSRNEFIVRYLRDRGLDRTKQQVASHIQQLKKRSSKELNGGSNPSSPSSAGFNSPYPSSDPYYQNGVGPTHHGHYGAPVPSSAHSYNGSGSGMLSSQSPIHAIAIRVNDAQPLQVPTHSLSRPVANQYSSGSATLTGVSPSSSGLGLNIRIRLLVPPHQDAISHLASSRINAIISLNPSFPVQTTTLGNKISVNNMYMLEETDNFMVQGNQIVCPLRLSPQTGMMISTQSAGYPISIEQTVYGGSSSLLKITYQLVHASQPPSSLSSNALYQYPPTTGPFTQF